MEEKPAAPRVPTVVLLTTDAEELHGQLKAVCVQLLPEWKEIVRKTDDVQVECLSFSYEEMVFMVVGLKGFITVYIERISANVRLIRHYSANLPSHADLSHFWRH